jgi:tetraether lipid synthase
VRGVNDDQVGQVVRFAIENADKITVVSFQPVSFTGRDEGISDDERRAKRYTLSHLAHDLETQLGGIKPLRDWFPLSALGPFGDLTDLLLAERADWGALQCGCHPNCGIGTALLVHKETKEMVPLARVLDVEGLLEDIQEITDAAQPRPLALAALAVALCRRYRSESVPRDFGLITLIRQFLSQSGARGSAVGAHASDARDFAWRVLFIGGMWFQDLFNYDFRRTEMCIIPYGTQEGEISFCAYNTGVGWRQIVEKMHATATVADWYKTRGRHAIYAKNQALPLAAPLGTVRLPVVG